MYILLCVFMVWPTKLFCNHFELCANEICSLKICGECKILFLGILGLKSLILKSYHLILTHFYCFELNHLVFQKLCFSSKIWWASAWFDRSILIFDRSKFLKFLKFWERESLSVSTGRGWFSTDRNSWIRFFKKQN